MHLIEAQIYFAVIRMLLCIIRTLVPFSSAHCSTRSILGWNLNEAERYIEILLGYQLGI